MTTLLEFICSNLQPIVNTVGLVLDIVGAGFVATEVVDQFNGNKFHVTPGVTITDYLGSDGTPNCYDNAVAESFFQLLKRERIKRKIYTDREEAFPQ